MTVISQLLLKHEHNISSCAKDILMKPLICDLDQDLLRLEIDEWECLVVDTYEIMKGETSRAALQGR